MTYATVASLNATSVGALPQPPPNTGLWTIGADGTKFAAVAGDCYGATAGVSFQGRSARGTGNAPDFLQAGDILVSYQGRSWKGDGFVSRGSVDVIANENHSASAGGSQVEVKACRSGTNTTGTTVTHALDADGLTRLLVHNLPTSDPHEAERVWNNSGVLTISAG